LKIILKDGQLLRFELARKTGLSLSTLSYIVRELENSGLLLVEEVQQKRGRPSQIVKINPSAWRVVGIKVGREEVRGTLFDASAKPLKKHRISILSDMRNNDGYWKAISEIVENLACENLLGVGICSSGIVEDGKVVVSHLMNVRNLDLKTLLKSAFKLNNFLLMNDVDALCYSLSKSNGEDFLVVSYGAGIGASFWKENQANHIEMGHLIVSTQGKCYCGQTGCLEYSASEYAVLKNFLGKEIDFEDFAWNEEEKYRPSIEKLRKVAGGDFSVVREFYNTALKMLSTIVGDLVMTLKPSKVIFLGEGIVNPQMVQIIRKNVSEIFNKDFVKKVDFKTGLADWELGVASATVDRFIKQLL